MSILLVKSELKVKVQLVEVYDNILTFTMYLYIFLITKMTVNCSTNDWLNRTNFTFLFQPISNKKLLH